MNARAPHPSLGRLYALAGAPSRVRDDAETLARWLTRCTAGDTAQLAAWRDDALEASPLFALPFERDPAQGRLEQALGELHAVPVCRPAEPVGSGRCGVSAPVAAEPRRAAALPPPGSDASSAPRTSAERPGVPRDDASPGPSKTIGAAVLPGWAKATTAPPVSGMLPDAARAAQQPLRSGAGSTASGPPDVAAAARGFEARLDDAVDRWNAGRTERATARGGAGPSQRASVSSTAGPDRAAVGGAPAAAVGDAGIASPGRAAITTAPPVSRTLPDAAGAAQQLLARAELAGLAGAWSSQPLRVARQALTPAARVEPSTAATPDTALRSGAGSTASEPLHAAAAARGFEARFDDAVDRWNARRTERATARSGAGSTRRASVASTAGPDCAAAGSAPPAAVGDAGIASSRAAPVRPWAAPRDVGAQRAQTLLPSGPGGLRGLAARAAAAGAGVGSLSAVTLADAANAAAPRVASAPSEPSSIDDDDRFVERLTRALRDAVRRDGIDADGLRS